MQGERGRLKDSCKLKPAERRRDEHNATWVNTNSALSPSDYFPKGMISQRDYTMLLMLLT